MKNHFGALALVVLLSLYFVAALGAVPAAHAFTVVTVDSTFCSGKGTWDSTFLICALTADYAVPSGDNLELICGTGPRGTSLHIGSGTTLTIPSGAALTIPAGVPCGDVQALLGGTLTVDAGGTVYIFYNAGPGDALINFGTVKNYGTIDVADGPTPGGSTACATGMVNNGGGATIYNYGTIVLNNTGCTEGLFNNNLSNIYNFGTIDTRPSTGSDAAVNAGFILNECSGIILGPPGIVNGYTQASPCGPTNSALEFPLGVAALFLLLVPLLIILRKRESSLSRGRNQTLLLQ